MSSTDSPTATEGTIGGEPSAALSGAVFDDVIAPLAERRRAEGASAYFPASGDAGRGTYFETPGMTRMGPEDFEFPGGGRATGLVDALAAHWASLDEPELAAATEHFQAIVDALRIEAVRADGSVDIFCYTLF